MTMANAKTQTRIAPADILAEAAKEKFCDVVVIGIRPDASVMVNWSGTTLASLLLFLKLAEMEAEMSWRKSARKYAKNRAKQGKSDVAES